MSVDWNSLLSAGTVPKCTPKQSCHTTAVKLCVTRSAVNGSAVLTQHQQRVLRGAMWTSAHSVSHWHWQTVTWKLGPVCLCTCICAVTGSLCELVEDRHVLLLVLSRGSVHGPAGSECGIGSYRTSYDVCARLQESRQEAWHTPSFVHISVAVLQPLCALLQLRQKKAINLILSPRPGPTWTATRANAAEVGETWSICGEGS